MLRITAELPVKCKKDFDRCLSHWECRNLESLIMSEFYVIMLFQLVLDPLSWYKFPAGLLVQQICTDGHDCRWGHGQSRLFLLLFFFFSRRCTFMCLRLCFSVFEMVQCAVEYGSPCEPDHITFGEFSILVTELQNYYSKRWVIGEEGGYIKKRLKVGL